MRGYWLNKSNNLVVFEKNIIGRFFLLFFSHKLQVQLNDHVVAKGDRTGHIRYIGHLDKQTQPNLLFTGLELDSPGQSTLKLPHTKKTMYIVRQALEHNWCKYNCRRCISWKNHDFYNNQPRIKLFIGITTVSCSIFACLTTGISNFNFFFIFI